MYRIPIAMHNRLMRGEKPVAYAVIDTHMGKRVYAEKELFLFGTNLVLNGTTWIGATEATPPTGWITGNTGIFTIYDSGDGTPYDVCMKLAVNDVPSLNPDLLQSVTTVIGTRYRFSFAFKKGTATSGSAGVGTSLGGTQYIDFGSLTSAAWIIKSFDFIATTNTTYFYIVTIGGTAGLYSLFDSVSLVEIDSYLETSARVLSFGSFERTSQPIKDDVLTAYSGKQLQHMSIELDNADRYFSRLIAKEPFLGRTLSVYVGFEAEPEATHIRLFSGTISEVSIGNTMTIEAEEA